MENLLIKWEEEKRVNLTLVRRIQKNKSLLFLYFFLALLAASFSPNTSFAFSNAKITFDGIGDIDIWAIQNNVDGGGVSDLLEEDAMFTMGLSFGKFAIFLKWLTLPIRAFSIALVGFPIT